LKRRELKSGLFYLSVGGQHSIVLLCTCIYMWTRRHSSTAYFILC